MRKFLFLIFTLLLSWSSQSAVAATTLNMPLGVTPLSQDIYHLHMTIFYICVGIAVVVFGVMIYALINHRKSRGAKPADFHEHTSLEVAWAIIPFVILVVMAIPATRVLMAMEDSSKADVTIKITGYQWKWKYDYLDEGISFFSNLATPPDQIHSKQKKGKWYLYEVDNPLVVPVHKKIRFLVTANDVIHAWWVPELGVKRDAIPGFIHEAWARIEQPGIYRGQCAELCGANHAYMPIVVKAVSEVDYDKWVNQEREAIAKREAAAKQNWTRDELMKFGKETYEKYCAACHKVDGSGNPPLYPALQGSSIATGKPISRHIGLVLNGVLNTAMQAFKDQLSDSEIAAVVTYERNAWDNNTGDVVQPADVAKERSGAPAETTQPLKGMQPAAPSYNNEGAKEAIDNVAAPKPTQQPETKSETKPESQK